MCVLKPNLAQSFYVKRISWFSLISLSIITHADKIIGFKSIAAYRSGLEINTNVSKKDAEEGLIDVLQGMFCINGFKTLPDIV